MSGDDPTPSARQLRIGAFRVHKELFDRFSLEDTREIIRHLTVIEAILSNGDDEPPVRSVDEP